MRPDHQDPARPALDAAVGWIEESRRVWTERFEQLDQHLRHVRTEQDES
jgi:hypothetical protein